MLLLHLLSNPIQTRQKHLTLVLLWTKSWIKNNRRFSCSDDVINLMLLFWQIWFHFRAIFQKFCFFDTLYKKLCHNWNINQKENNLWHWIDKYADLSYRSLSFYWFFEYYVIMIYIGHMSSDLRSGYRTSFVCWIPTHNLKSQSLKYRLRYCNLAQNECVSFRPQA